MAAFQFPDPQIQETVINPITGSTYQWKNPPGKWTLVAQPKTQINDLIWEGDNPPSPPEDYKLWYSTDTLELYFYFCDQNGVCAWIPTSKPITLLEDLDTAVAELRTDIQAVNIATLENENRIGRTIFFSDAAPTIYDDVVYDDVVLPNELNYKFWYDDSRLELFILFRDVDGDDSYVPVSIPPETLPEPGVSTEAFTYTTGRLQTAIEENYVHNLNQDTSIAELQQKINDLTEIIKGNVARYIIDNSTGGPVSRPGEISCSSGFWSSVSKFSFGTADADGTATPSMSNGDIIETYNAKEDKTNRYTITNASGAPTIVEVQYISGDYFYIAGDELEVNIY